MSTYRPRLAEVVQCKQCHKSFETRHRRATYCTDSCRQLAYQARNRSQKVKPESKGGLDLSVNDLSVVAIGSATTALGNYLFNDHPAQQTLLKKLTSIEQGTEKGLSQLLAAAQMMIDFINAQAQNDPGLAIQLQTIQANRLATKQHLVELKQATKDRVLEKHGIKRR